MKFNSVLFISVMITSVLAEDEKLKEKIFLSQGNQIVSIHLATLGSTKYVALRFQRKLDSKLSKGKGAWEKTNFGDSSSTYCYKRELDMSEFEKTLVSDWVDNNKTVNFTYTCAELADDERRKSFLGFAETNCQCLEFTFDSKDVRRGWPN